MRQWKLLIGFIFLIVLSIFVYGAEGNIQLLTCADVGETDIDGDGYSLEGILCSPVDCNDSDANTYPGATETCGDGIDQNCDGSDASCPTGDGGDGGGGGRRDRCNDNKDNDGDGLIDYPDDPGCVSRTDDNEYNEPEPCRERWVCEKWSSCANGITKRTCTEVNNCNTTNFIPAMKKSCREPEQPQLIQQPQQPITQPEKPKIVPCKLYGVSSGKYVFCWYWWVIIFILLLALVGYLTFEELKKYYDQDKRTVYVIMLIILLLLPLIMLLAVPSPINFAITAFVEVIALIYLIVKYISLAIASKPRGNQDITPTLAKHVKDELKANYPVDVLKRVLYTQGYDKEQVDTLISETLNEIKGIRKQNTSKIKDFEGGER